MYGLKSDLNSVQWLSACDIMHATCTTLVWDGPPVAIDGPSLIESFDFCVSENLSSTI